MSYCNIGKSWLVKRYMRRPSEQLYRTASEPYEMNNVVKKPELAETKNRLSDALDQWMIEQQDPGADVDTEQALKAARKGQHLHGRER